MIVIYIAPCPGGVFDEEPDCYELVEGKVVKMSFLTWKKSISKPVCLCRYEAPHSVSRITWSSVEARNAFTNTRKVLILLINNGDWKAILGGVKVFKKSRVKTKLDYQFCRSKLSRVFVAVV